MHTRDLRSFLWFATGVALTITTIAVFTTMRASAAVTPGESTFVPITPCRLLDTRPGTGTIGTRSRPVDREPFEAQVTGTNGNCTIPTDATAISMNVTAVRPTARSFLQTYPADVDRPVRGSSLNFLAEQVPVPNKVDVKLGAGGSIKFYNDAGTVHLVADVIGYYKASTVADLEARVVAAENELIAQRAEMDAVVAGSNVIPRGTTVTGYIETSNTVVVELPGTAPTGLTSDMVNFAADGFAGTVDDDATCTGRFDNPTAPPGKVCIYFVQISFAENLSGEAARLLPDRYFSVRLSSASTTRPPSLVAAWAYTAP